MCALSVSPCMYGRMCCITIWWLARQNEKAKNRGKHTHTQQQQQQQQNYQQNIQTVESSSARTLMLRINILEFVLFYALFLFRTCTHSLSDRLAYFSLLLLLLLFLILCYAVLCIHILYYIRRVVCMMYSFFHLIWFTFTKIICALFFRQQHKKCSFLLKFKEWE